MALSLRDKLNRIKETQTPPPAPSAMKLYEYVARFPADEALFHLPASALSRMSFEGDIDPARTLFLDTETTGLSGGAGTVAFLVGLGRVEGGELVVRQYLMPGYGAEPLLLEALGREAAHCDTVVTFNGKSFDVPLLTSRHILNRIPCPLSPMRHLDLIYPARRVWKLRLKDCSLGNLEEKALGIHREHDLPGSLVPERYFSYLKSGDMSLLQDIVDHNRQDIVSLSTLLIRLCEIYAAPDAQESMLDVYALGRALEKRGETQEAGRLYKLAARPVRAVNIHKLSEARISPMANRELSMLLRRAGDQGGAEEVWQEMIRRGQMGAFPYIELAKLREHRDGNWLEALELTERALLIATDEKEKDALKYRKARLQRCLARANKEDQNAMSAQEKGGNEMGLFDSFAAESAGRKAYGLHVQGNRLYDEGKSEEAKKKHEQALELYDKAIKGGCLRVSYLMAYGVLLLRFRRYQEAHDIFLKADKQKTITKPERNQLRINYAICQWKLGHLDSAIEQLKIAKETAATGVIYGSLGYMLIEKAIQTGDFSEAIAFNEEGLAYDDEDAVVLDNMGQLYLAMNDKEKALSYFEKAHEIKPHQVDTLYYLAKLANERGEKDKAREYLKTALNGNYSSLATTSREQAEALLAQVQGD